MDIKNIVIVALLIALVVLGYFAYDVYNQGKECETLATACEVLATECEATATSLGVQLQQCLTAAGN